MIAKGRFIQFVDGDDYLVQTAYEHCLDIVRYHQPDIVTFNYVKNRQTDTPPYELPTPISGTAYMSNHNLHGSACSYIFRSSIRGTLQFTPGIVYGEDEEFTLSSSCVPKESSRWRQRLITIVRIELRNPSDGS